MPKTALTLSEQIAKTLKVYTAQAKNSMLAQSEVVVEALREFFERHSVKIEGLLNLTFGMSSQSE
jgi:hypothetical protein